MVNAYEGKTVVITGSTRGIGKAMALAFAAQGAAVVVHGTRAERAAAVVKEIEDQGGKAAMLLGDVSDDTLGSRLAAFAVERFGSLDIFIANAAIVTFEPFLDVTPEVFRRFVDVNFVGAFTTSQAAAREMVKAGRGGRILYLASVAGVHGMYGYAGYCAPKSAVMSLARVAALELAPHRITVNAIAPGPVENEMMEELWGPEKLKERSQTIPAGRLATPEEVASVALFLASDAASYITGQTLFLDGGATAAGLYTHEVYKRAAAPAQP